MHTETTERKAQVTVLTGGIDKPYALALTLELISKGVSLDVIGSSELEGLEAQTSPHLAFLNLHGATQQKKSVSGKILGVMAFYVRLFRYCLTSKADVFHILWNNRAVVFDRTILMVFYKMLGKRLVLTVHNVNAGKRDNCDSLLNRLTLRAQYHLADHLFVHTELMKRQLCDEFGITSAKSTVIPFGLNSTVPNTSLTPEEAKAYLGMPDRAKSILFFGAIRPYKGLDQLVAAFQGIAGEKSEYRLVIAGECRKGSAEYLDNIRRRIEGHPSKSQIITRIEYIPDGETEVYFKACDVLVLPYVHIFQSGVLFLAYNFGLPVIATNVGSFIEYIIEGQTGFLSRPGDVGDLAAQIKRYFESDLFKNIGCTRHKIRRRTEALHSWKLVGAKTLQVYSTLMRDRRA